MVATNMGRKLYVCATVQNADLNQTAYEALTWVQVLQVGNIGETGTAVNVLSYDTMDTTVTQKQKGVANAGDPTVEVARSPTDAGQVILRTAAGVTDSYAFKFEHSDGPSGMSNTIIYSRGIVTGPTRPNGGVEDFDLEVYTLGLNQEEIVVDPA